MKIVSLFIKYFPTYLSAFGVTLKITALSLIIGTVIGIVFAIFKLSGKKPLEMIANFYISIIRGTPLMVQILFIYLGIPALLSFKWDLTVACVVIMSINCGAYMAELIRGGIEAVDKGQVEAANSLGMNYAQTMMKVVLPQALRIMLPTIINQFIVTLKDTSLLSVIALRELTQNTKIIVANNMETFTMYFICGVWYWVIVTILSRIAKYIERRTKYGK
ncbi:MAG: amino acid ABC transporter permease [Clostridiales bacterium]|nr:amino acid ABC transporter permease [Clostridiales bacterium]